MTETLEITTEHEDQLETVWAMLDGLAGMYDDNSGDPDGNAWFPSDIVTREEAAGIVEAGLGKMTQVLVLDDDELADALDIQDVLGLAVLCEDWDALRNAVDDRVAGWAHYGAYGAGDSVWIVERK